MTLSLREMLTYRRPAGSRTEREFIRRYIVPTGARADAFGNYHLTVGQGSRVAWMCHTDTVHRTDGRQEVQVVKGIATVKHPRRARGRARQCLGADDTTGVWLMLEMIAAGVPGLYLFHYGEEQGCIGSSAIVAHTPEVVAGVDYAVSLDRRGYDSVITHQLGCRTASDVFAWSLIGALGLDMAPDPTGVFTDSEVYAGIIPECTNLSVGYARQHSERESQDMVFALDLRDVLVSFDESALIVDRDPLALVDKDELRAWDDETWDEKDADGLYWWERQNR
jgi:hypothetical protein